jgi:hypothetical protein
VTAAELVKSVEAAGGILALIGKRLHCEVPDQAIHLLPAVREQRHEVAKVLQERLAGNVKRWRRAQCVACDLGSSNPAILHREFTRWAGCSCTMDEFTAALGRLGFELDSDGMIEGLILIEDFAAAVEYERMAT